MVSKVRTQSRFSFRVRMKRSAQPFPSGARKKAGELATPKKASSCWKAQGQRMKGISRLKERGKLVKVCNPIAEAFRGGHGCGNPVEPSNRRGLMAECRPILGIDRLHAFALRVPIPLLCCR